MAIQFGANDCSCSCNPCGCNPCQCPDRRADFLATWHLHGLQIQTNQIETTTLTNATLVHLALVTPEHPWLEMILCDHQITTTQLPHLLTQLENILLQSPHSKLTSNTGQLPVYQAEITFSNKQSHPWLKLDFSTIGSLVRPGTLSLPQTPVQWHYNNFVSLQSPLQHL
jgi:hypothetical protein